MQEYIFVTMKAFFLLIALYTISGKQAVPSGDIPAGSSCVYEQTDGRSGQLTAGNSLMLTLSGCEGMTLHSVTLRMHSNTRSGAGEMTMAIGEAPIWMIYDASFSDEAWYGDYSKEWVDISQSFSGLYVPEGDDITLQISASENSLYLQSVQLNYSAPQPKTYTVSFDTHIAQTIEPVTELEASGGIILPDIELNDANWRFYGWANEAVDDSEQAPSVCRAGSMYFPSSDCTLHAVYVQESDVQPWLPTDDLLLEDYLIALYTPGSELMLHATGPVTNGMLETVSQILPMENGWVSMPLDQISADAVYTLHVKDDTLTIRHKATDTPVLLVNGGKFASSTVTNNAWIISPSVVEGDDMPRYVISGIAGSKLYYISYNLAADYTVSFC
ncbi:MAG: hypothetical protein IIU10_05440, partial [Paludibacteraceae bacterium]|nr:hypothetical protein [Paludibacteraceae bacterium]